MKIKSIITKLDKKELTNDEKGTQYIRAETLEGNEMMFWGSNESCVNLLALEQQNTPVLISCVECEKEETCTHLLGDYFSIHEKSIVTIHPYDPRKISKLLITVKDTDKLVKALKRSHN